MTYSTLIQQEGITNEFLVVLTPARQITSWATVTGNVYSNNFTLGYVSSVEIDGTAQTLVTSASVGAGEYYWDNINELVYINSATPSAVTIVVYYELFFGTKGAHFPRIPTSAKSSTNIDVYFDPVIIRSPSFNATLTDSIIGYLPSKTSQIEIGNPDHDLEQHIYHSSFNQKQIKVYHWLGSLETANMKLLINGQMENITYKFESIRIQILDRIDVFNKEYRNTNVSFYNSTTWASINPSYIGKPIRFVYGRADGVFLVNLDYETDTPTTSTNRVWALREGGANTFTGTVPASPASTTTKTYLDDVTGLSIGDTVWVDKSADEYALITNVDYDNNYIEHAAFSGAACATSDTVKRGTLGNLIVTQGDVEYNFYYNRDYTESVADNIVKITLRSTAESNASISTLTGNETLHGRIYGEQNDVTKGGVAFGSDSSKYNSLTNPAVILFDLLKQCGVSESDINLTSFDTLSTAISSKEIGFALPKRESSNFPNYKTIFAEIFTSCLIQLFIDSDGKWKVDYLKAHPTADVTIDDTEILQNSLTYSIDYKDIISDIIIAYNFREAKDNYLNATSTSNVAKYVHGITRQKTFETLLIDSSNASTLATQLIDIYGERLGFIEFSCKNRFFNNYISDTVSISLEKHPGFSYSAGTENTRSYEIIDIAKSANTIKIKACDNKGIQDNTGDF